jgi:peroxiredoxin Q/BCP
VVILGISFDSVEENAAFAEKFSFPFRLLCDTDRAIGLAYGATDTADNRWARRISYLIAPDRTVARAYAKVDPSKHPDQVLADLAQLPRTA